MAKKTTVNIRYPCYICAVEYGNAYPVIAHVRKEHGYILEPRHVGYRRPPDGLYAYENNKNQPWEAQHFGCPSCWYHTPKVNHVEHLMKHIMETHEPKRIEGFVNPDKEENELVEESDDDEQDSNNRELTALEKDQAEVTEAILKKLDEMNTMFKKLFD